MTDEAVVPTGMAHLRTGAISAGASRLRVAPALAAHLDGVVAMFDASPTGAAIWSVDGELLHANPVLCELLQEPLAELLGRPFENFIDPTDAPELLELIEDLWSGDRNHFACDLRGRRPDGSEHWLRAAINPVYGSGGRPAYLVSQIFDLTPSRGAVSASDQMADEAPVMLWLADEHGVPRSGNRRSYEFIGQSAGTPDLSVGLFDHTHPGDYAEVAARLRHAISSQEPFAFRARAKRHDGTWRWLEHRAEPLFAADGRFRGYAGASVDVTDQEQVRRELAETRRLFRSVTEAGPIAVARADRHGYVTYANSRWSALLDDQQRQLLGTNWRGLLHPVDVAELTEQANASIDTGEAFSYRVSAVDAGRFALAPRHEAPGTRYWAELRIVPVYDDDAEHDGWVATLTDVSAEIAAGSRADRLARVLDAGSDFLIIAERTGAITYVNDAAFEVLGVSAPDPSGADATPDFLMDVLTPDSFELFHELVEPILIEEGIWRGELVLRSRRGQEIPVSALIIAHHDEHGRLESISAVARDISDLKLAQSQLHQLATHDYLTGMPNRVLLYDRLEQALARYQRYGQPVALLYLDLDGFKPVNDDHGHHVGDRVLQMIADRINGVVRETDTAARVGGDEFCVLVEGVDEPALVHHVAERLIQVISEPITVDGCRSRVGVSIGLVAVDDSCAEPDALMALADAAMYRAKAAGRGQVIVYDPSSRSS